MRKISKTAGLFMGLALLLVPAALGAGVFIGAATSGDRGGGDMEIRLERERMEMNVAGGQMSGRFIFHGDRQVLWIVDEEEKKVTEVTAEDIARLGGLLREFEEQLQALPPEQRAMAESMLRRTMPFYRAGEPVFRKLESGVETGSWNADRYEARVAGRKVSEVWFADWEQLGLSADDFRVKESLRRFLGSLGGLAPMPLPAGPAGGFPVRVVSYHEDRVSGRMEVKVIEKRDFEPAVFEVPGDFKREALDFPGGR